MQAQRQAFGRHVPIHTCLPACRLALCAAAVAVCRGHVRPRWRSRQRSWQLHKLPPRRSVATRPTLRACTHAAWCMHNTGRPLRAAGRTSLVLRRQLRAHTGCRLRARRACHMSDNWHPMHMHMHTLGGCWAAAGRHGLCTHASMLAVRRAALVCVCVRLCRRATRRVRRRWRSVSGAPRLSAHSATPAACRWGAARR